LHEPVEEITENSSAEITAEIVSDEKIEKVEAWLQNENTYETVELENSSAYNYSAQIAKKKCSKMAFWSIELL
jgi:hypothetical protein